ncbi:serine/threonine-protein kinase PknD [Rubritalea halochordaticola]|uniref:Serine/threonine-protein kinase PknD n=1 Tax=Rubritalea halochordaticola TaxID=714537 RepID=A0ABP9UWC3_9BACT
MTDERYEIRGKIGQGGVGAVYRAYDTQLRREVAIKRVLTEGGYEDAETATKNLLKEATALSSVQHPHICTVYDAGMDKEGPYVVMELINGKTLDEMVERGTLTYEDFREVAIQSQEAMIAAQDLDLVHRDLKPSNVMVCWLPSGRFQVKLVDFGLAKFSAQPSLQTIDHGDAVFGSIFFMAPEQFERTPLDRRTDMYSLGAMYYFALAGTYPFNGDTAPQVMASHLQNTVQPLHEVRPDLPKWLCDWVMWHISRNMDDRPESARVALEKFISDEASAKNEGAASPAPSSGPQLVIPQTSTQAATVAAGTRLETGTAPQPITPPAGGRSITASHSVRPAAAGGNPLTGATAIQPASAAKPTTHSHPVTSTATAASQTTPAAAPQAAKGSFFSKMSNTTKIVLASVIGAAIIIFGILIISRLSANNETEVFNKLVKQIEDPTAKDIPTSEEELDILLKSLADLKNKDRHAVLLRLQVAKAVDNSFNPDRKILSYATTDAISDTTRENLFQILSRRQNTDVISDLLAYAADHVDQGSSRVAIEAAAKNPKDDDFRSYLNILRISENSQVTKTAEKALQSVISNSYNKTTLTDQLLSTVDQILDESKRLSVIRLLGATGTERARRKIETSLKSDEDGLRIAAAAGYADWPNDQPFDALITAIESEQVPQVRRSMFNSAFELLTADHSHGSSSEAELKWMTISSIAQTDSDKLRIISHLVNANAPYSTKTLEAFTNDRHSETVKDRALRALDKIKNR